MEMYFKSTDNYARNFKELETFFLNSNKSKDWADDKSAKTLACYVSSGKFEEFMNEYLDRHFKAKFKESYKLIFEKRTQFDESSKGPRDHDLCTNDIKYEEGNMTACVEAKVNEPFSKLNIDQYKHSVEELLKRPNSKLHDRLKSLFYVFSNTSSDNFDKDKWNEFLSLRYQLFTGLAGAIAEAKENNSGKALFVIFSFQTSLMDKTNAETNEKEYLEFLKFLEVDIDKEPPYKLNLQLETTEEYQVKYCVDNIDIYIDYHTIVYEC